ncbi:MAG: molybdopterin-dependent oxidoreductase [Candidatus Lambdaproteobacteria bacterium]|nr:molybdopterin-dependent oxidoreductase [Candidatus Lambdaproteobacteria bacterium]
MSAKHAFSRRTFLSLSAAVAASAAAWPALRPARPVRGSILEPGMTATHSFCEICFWKCGIDVWKNAEGRVVQITGQAGHPLSNGRLCPRGTGGMGQLYDPDRIRQPMLRRGDTWQTVSWDEALGFTAERMQALKARHGAESMATITHGTGAGFIRHLMQAYGASTFSAPSYAQCRGPRDVAFELTFGAGAGSPEITDIENATFMVFLGTHLGENMHNTQVQEFARAVGRGTELVVVDPRFSVAAGKARYWLPIKPGTDLALLLAWMRLLLDEGTYNKPFVERHCVGLEPLRAALTPYTPEWAYTQTGIDPAVIREIGRKLGMHGPTALIHPGRRTNWYGDDTQRVRAVAILNALLGNWGHRGGFFSGHRINLGKVATPPYPPTRKALDALARRHWPLADEIPTQFLRDHTLAGDDPAIKGWMVYGTDLLNNIPDKDKTIATLKSLELLVVIDVLPIELTGWADVVLPEATYLERYDDLHAPTWKVPYVALRQPVVEPLYDSKPAWWMARQLGRRLGLDAWFPWNDVEEYLQARLRTAGLSLAELRRDGTHVQQAPPPYTDAPRFNTPSGKVELFSTRLKALGFDPVPVFTPPSEAPPGFFRLLIGRAPVHSFGRTTNNRVLGELMPENVLWVNAIAAREFGLAPGQAVRLVNQDGVRSRPIKVKVTERIRPDCVYMVHGFGRDTEKMAFANGRGTADNDLLTRVHTDPIMGATSTNTNFVTIERKASA